jgi:hypothetical protein
MKLLTAKRSTTLRHILPALVAFLQNDAGNEVAEANPLFSSASLVRNVATRRNIYVQYPLNGFKN